MNKKAQNKKPVQKFVRDTIKPGQEFMTGTGKLEKDKAISIEDERQKNLRKARQDKANKSFMKDNSRSEKVYEGVHTINKPPNMLEEHLRWLEENC